MVCVGFTHCSVTGVATKTEFSNLAFFFLFSFFNYIYTLQYNTIQNNINSVTVKKQMKLDQFRCASEVTRSTAAGILIACPMDDLAPRMAWIEDRRREKDRRHRNH